jgi:peptide/nickel transport system substrate-binding protein
MMILLNILVVVGLLVTACAAPATPEPPAEEEPTEEVVVEEEAEPEEEEEEAGDERRMVTVGIAEDVSALDPPADWAIVTTWVVSNMFDCLVWRGRVEHDEFEGRLAESWEVLDDVTWRFYLREGIEFHNGEPYNAEAAKFSIDRILEDDQMIVHSQWTHIKEVRIVDEYTIDIETHDPVPDMLSKLAGTGCGNVPPKYVQEIGKEEFAMNPVGTGPFVFEEWERDQEIRLVANDDYWEGPPEIAGVTFKVIPEPSTRVAELLTGGLDITDPVEPQDWERIEENEDVELVKANTTRTMLLVHRCDEPFVTADPKIRAAIDYAIDDQALVELIGDMGVPTLSRVTPPTMSATDKYFGQYNYDSDQARQLLEEAGYDGEELTFHTTTTWLGQKEVAEAIAAMLTEVGLNIDLQILEPSTFREQVYYPQDANEEIMMLALGNSFFDPWIAMKGFYSKQERVRSHWQSDRFDELWEKALVEMDPQQREEYFLEMQDLVVEGRPYTFLYLLKTAYGKSKQLEWPIPPDNFYWMYNARFVE